MAASGRQTVSLSVPARADYVGLARLALSGVCRAAGVGSRRVDDLKLAVTEAAARFVTARDGGADTAVGHLSYVFRIDDERLVIEIAGAPAQALPSEELALGRAILEATVDQWSEDDGCVRLVKFLGPRAE